MPIRARRHPAEIFFNGGIEHEAAVAPAARRDDANAIEKGA